ncbi:hypothetical protein [Pseudoclavibacter helvolus]|uniref:hypothetical protein n=1 Tax=Pseudoclavibacter helvolus TaxID=255205 RepID=UPI000838ABDC|nr:hypothetical protein [Pseudoclavibacter helvolus]
MAELFSSRRRVSLGEGQTDASLAARGRVGSSYVSPSVLAKNRGAPRNADLMAAIAALDTEPDRAAVDAALTWIRDAYDARGGGLPVGLFSRCYLGSPYIDHSMSLGGFICEHYTAAEMVPVIFAGARRLAANAAYDYIEVYDDGTVVPVRPDGRAAV